MKAKRCNAFTLIELMVVVAIIAVLASLLLPALARAKQKSQTAVCLNRARQWSVAMVNYLHANDEIAPRENVVSGVNTWQMAADEENTDVWYNSVASDAGVRPVSDYVNILNDPMQFYSSRSLFHRPAARFTENPDLKPQFSFAMNSKLITPNLPRVRSSDIQDPARTPYFVESGVPGEKVGYSKQSIYNGQPHAFASRFSWRHLGFGTIAFADSHSELMPGKKVVDCDDASPSAGRAIFPFTEIVWSADPTVNPN